MPPRSRNDGGIGVEEQIIVRVQEGFTIMFVPIRKDANIRQLKQQIIARLNILRVSPPNTTMSAPITGAIPSSTTSGYVDPVMSAMLGKLASSGLSIADPISEEKSESKLETLPPGIKYTEHDIRLHLAVDQKSFDTLSLLDEEIIAAQKQDNSSQDSVIPTRRAVDQAALSAETLGVTGSPGVISGPLPDSFLLSKLGIRDSDVMFISLRDLIHGSDEWLPVNTPSYEPLYDKDEDEYDDEDRDEEDVRNDDKDAIGIKGKKQTKRKNKGKRVATTRGILGKGYDEEEDSDYREDGDDDDNDDDNLEPEGVVRKLLRAEKLLGNE